MNRDGKIPTFDEVMAEPQKVSNGRIPSFEDIMNGTVKKKEEASGTISEPSPNGIDNIPQSQLPSYSEPKETKTKSFLDLDIERQPGFLLTNPELDKPQNKYSLRNLYNEAAQKRYDEKLEISKSNIKATPESLSAYNQKRLQEVNKDIQKANNDLEGTKGLLAGPQAAKIGGGDRPVKEILDELETTVAQANQYKVRLKNSIAAEAAKTFIPMALAEGPRFDPTKLAREIVKVADPEQELIFQEAEKGGSTLPGITQANLEMMGLEITEGYVKSQPQTDETAAIVKNIEEKKSSFDDRNPELVAQHVREKLGVYFYNKGKGGFFGYSGRNIESAINDPETGLTPSEKKVAINSVLPTENKLIFSTEIPGSGFFRSFKNAIDKSLVNTENTITGMFGGRDDSDRAQELLNSEVEQSRFRQPGENPTWKQELAYLNNKPELTVEEKTQKVNLEKFVDVRNSFSKFKDGVGDLTGQVAEMALLTKGIGAAGKAITAFSEGGGMLSGLTTGAIGTALSNETVGLFVTSYLNAYDNYKTQAIQLMPGQQNAANRDAYAKVMAGVEGLSERIFNDVKVLKAFSKEIAPSVAGITNRFINKEITQQVAREELQSTLKQYLKPFGKQFLKSELEEPTEEAVVDIADGMAQSIFGGQPFDINKTGNKALNTFLTTAINSPLVSGLAAHGAARQNNTQNAFMKSAIVDMASNPASYLKSVEDLRLTNQITQDEANEKIQLIKSSSKFLKEMPASIPVSKKTESETTIENKEFDYPEASSYLLHRLNEAIVNNQLETNQDEALKPVLEQQVKRSVEIRKGIIDGSIGVTPELEPITDNEKKAQELGIADANTVAPEQLIGTPFQETQAAIRENEDLIPDSRQTKINELIEQVRSYNDLRKNDKNKSQQLNEIRVAANELGLNFDNKKGYGILKNESGNRVQTRSSQTNSSEAVDFTDENYSPQTKEQIQNILTDDAALVGLPIKGEDGFRLSDRQKQAALKSIQAGKPTKGAKAIYDFIEGAVKGGNIEIEDKTTGQAVMVPIDEYFDMFKEAPQELTDEQIIELNTELGEQSFSEIFDNALNEDYGNDNRNVSGEAAQTSEAEASENPQAAASGEAPTSVSDKTQTETGVDKYPTRKQFENANQINSQDDATTRLSNGERIFAIPEMDEQPIELRSVDDISKYTPDQLIAIQRDYDPFEQQTEVTKPIYINGNQEESGIESGEETGQEDNVNISEQGGSNTGSVEPPFIESRIAINAEPPATELSHRGLQNVSNEFSLPDVKTRDRKTDVKLRQNARETVDNWAEKGEYAKNVEGLIVKAENGDILTDEERIILQGHLANVVAELRAIKDKSSPEFDAKLSEIKRLKEAGEKTRSEAGAALRIGVGGSRPSPIEDYGDAMVAKMEANNVDVLTEAQKAEVEKYVKTYEERAKIADDKVRLLEEKMAELEAQKELNRQDKKEKSKPRTAKKKTAADFKAEREKFKRELSQAKKEHDEWLEKQGIQKSGFSGLTLTPKMIKAIGKIIGSHVEELGNNLAQVTAKVFEEIKELFPGITQRDVHDIIAGEYSQQRPTKTQLQKDLKDLKDEAYYINKLEKLYKGEDPKTEKAKIERNKNIKELQDKIKTFKKEEKESEKFYGEESTDDAKKLESAKKRNEDAAKKINEKIANKDFDEKEKPTSVFDNPELKKKYPVLYKETLDALHKKEVAKGDFDVALMKDRVAKMDALQKFGYWGKKVIGTTKALKSGIDDSGVLVQNILAMIAHPRSGVKAFKQHALDAFSEKRYNRWLTELHNNTPVWDLIQKSGLNVTEPQDLRESNREEAFSYNLLDRTKVGKYLLKPFERAFTSIGNAMRVNMFLKITGRWAEEGRTFENSPDDYKSLADVLNTETGRGKLHKNIERASELVTAGIWSPRLMASRLNILGLSDITSPVTGKGYYAGLTPRVRRMAAADVGKFIGTGLTLMVIAAVAGLGVDLDPESPTFGTIKMGNKRVNVFDGFSKYGRTVAQLIAGKKKRGEVIGKFFRGSTTPAAGVSWDIITGKDYMGKPITAEGEVKNLMAPMSASGIVQNVQRDGTMGLVSGLAQFFGANITDQRDYENERVKNIPESLKADYERTNDKGFLPPQVQPKITYKGQEIDLSSKQHEEFEEMVESERAPLIDSLVKNEAYKKASDEERKKALSKVYDRGRETAKLKFFQSHKNLIEDANKAIEEENKESEKQRKERSN